MEMCEMLISGYDMVITYINSCCLWLVPQEVFKVKLVKHSLWTRNGLLRPYTLQRSYWPLVDRNRKRKVREETGEGMSKLGTQRVEMVDKYDQFISIKHSNIKR